MKYVSPPSLFSAAIELLPQVAGVPLAELSEEEQQDAVLTAVRLARSVAKEFTSGAWAPTIQPIPSLDVQNQGKSTDPHPEWIRLPTKGKCPYTSLSRGTLYNLIGASKVNGYKPPVKSVVLRHRGAVRGVRLISYDSLMEYLSNQAGQQSPEQI
jgi:hypothetical protein